MLVNHLIFVGDYWLANVNLRHLAFVEDAQGFVFLSGLLVGLVYGPKMLRRGFVGGAQALYRRAGELYLHALGLIGLVLIVAVLLPVAQESWRDWLGDLSWTHPVRLISTALLIFQPTFMDILPQYIVYMLFAPLLLWMCLKGRTGEVVACSFLIWLAAQFGLHRPATVALDQWLAGSGELGVRTAFDLLGWQIVFFGGMVLGVLTATGRIRWDEVFRPDRSLIPKLALAGCLFFLPLRVATAHGLMPTMLLDRFHAFENRTDFGLVYLINFAAAALGLAWLLIAGPRSSRPWIRGPARALTGFLQTPFLRLLGRHSLQVYCWHVLIVYAVRYWDHSVGPWPELTKLAIGLACVALLAVPPLWRERALRKGQPA